MGNKHWKFAGMVLSLKVAVLVFTQIVKTVISNLRARFNISVLVCLDDCLGLGTSLEEAGLTSTKPYQCSKTLGSS